MPRHTHPAFIGPRKCGLWFLPLLLAAGAALAQTPPQAERGTLPRGTSYEIRMPTPWNGVLISDLDFAQTPDAPRYQYLLKAGYAVSGTARRADRPTQYDPAREIDDLVNVMDRVEQRYGKPRRILQYGHSGGGHVALAMSETRPDRIDGAIVGCAHTPVWLMNSELDAWFTLKTLIAPELAIIDLPADHSAITSAWKQSLEKAQQTPLGRARIALATSLGQLAAWVGPGSREPDARDVNALQSSMFESTMIGAAQPTGQSRRMFEQGGRGQPSWNTGVVYSTLFDSHTDPDLRNAVRQLYTQAGARLEDDLRQLDVAPRIAADPKAVKHWSAPGRTVTGEPKVPVLRIHTNGDKAVPVSLVQGYDALVAARGYGAHYRTAFVNAAGHCTFSAAESAAAVESVMRRIDSGQWGDTSPTALNTLARTLDPGSEARYYSYRQFPYARSWVPAVSEQLGRKP